MRPRRQVGRARSLPFIAFPFVFLFRLGLGSEEIFEDVLVYVAPFVVLAPFAALALVGWRRRSRWLMAAGSLLLALALSIDVSVIAWSCEEHVSSACDWFDGQRWWFVPALIGLLFAAYAGVANRLRISAAVAGTSLGLASILIVIFFLKPDEG